MAILLPLLITIVGSVLYTLLIHKRVESFRSFLSEASSARKQKTLQDAMVLAFNGRGRIMRVSLFSVAPVALLLCFIAELPLKAIFGLADNYSLIKSTEHYASAIEDNISRLEKLDDEISLPDESNSVDDVMSEALRIQDRTQSLLSQLLRLQKEGIILTVLGIIIAFVGFVFVLKFYPQTVYCMAMEGEIAKFTSRIHQLASKQELSALWLAELKIKDLDSLTEYLEVATEIAKRHGVEAAISFLYFWKDSKKAD